MKSTKSMMTKRERMMAALNFERPDRVPIIQGWLIDDVHYQALAGASAEEFWADREGVAIRAYQALDVDALQMICLPSAPGEFRGGLDKERYESYQERYRSAEDVLAYAQSLPDPAEAARAFDADAWADEFEQKVHLMRSRIGDIVWLPTLWDIIHPTFEWYPVFGYENYLLFLTLYPEAADRFFAIHAATGRLKSEKAAALYAKLDMVPLTLVGTDTCGSNGPIMPVTFLRECYFPHVAHALEPVHEAGIRTVWHSDGDIRPIVDEVLKCGVGGFQGFQVEYGVDIADLAAHRTLSGDPLTIFSGMSVTTNLPHGTVDDVRREMERVIDVFSKECALFICPSSNVLPDCPLENVIEAHRHVIAYSREKYASG